MVSISDPNLLLTYRIAALDLKNMPQCGTLEAGRIKAILDADNTLQLLLKEKG